MSSLKRSKPATIKAAWLEDAAKAQGRAEGARFAWRPAVGTNDASKARTTTVSRSWRKVVEWLADPRTTKPQIKKREAWWNIMWYDHPRPKQGLATEAQKVAMDSFERWRKTITTDMLRMEVVSLMLEEVARKQAESEEAAASKATTLNWVSWMHEGPAAGSGRQHKMSKVAQGWAPQQSHKTSPRAWPALRMKTLTMVMGCQRSN